MNNSMLSWCVTLVVDLKTGPWVTQWRRQPFCHFWVFQSFRSSAMTGTGHTDKETQTETDIHTDSWVQSITW